MRCSRAMMYDPNPVLDNPGALKQYTLRRW